MRTSLSPDELIDTRLLAHQTTGSTVDLPDGGLYDTSRYKWILVMIIPAIVTGTASVSFFESDANAASSQSALLDDTGASLDFQIGGGDDGLLFVQKIRADSMKRYLNIEVAAGTTIAYSLIIQGIGAEYSASISNTYGSGLTELVTMA